MTKVTIDETTYSVTVAEENVNVTVADATETIQIQIASGASLHQVISSGDGNSLVVGSTGGLTTLKSLSAGDNVTFSDDGNTITISSTEDDLSNNTTDDLAEGTTNLYFSDALVDTALGSVTGHIIPSLTDTYDLGSPTNVWRDLYLGPNSLYVDGQQIVSSDEGTIDITTDAGQNLRISAGGTLDLDSAGDITRLLDPSITLGNGSGTVNISGTLQSPTTHIGELELSETLFNSTTANQNLEIRTNGSGYLHANVADLYVGPLAGAVKIDENSISTTDATQLTIEGFTNSADMTTAINTAESNANTYTDTRETAITTAYQAYADQSEADAITTSNSYADTAIANLVDSAPATLDTLNELAAALGDDPNFATTVTNSIATKWTQDNTKISNWDTAYSWGDHSVEGYLTSYTETDPIFTGHVASSILSTDITNWNTAYGWGDHSIVGYITDYTVTEADVTQHQAALSITESQISDLTHYTDSDARTAISLTTDSPSLSYDNVSGVFTYVDPTGSPGDSATLVQDVRNTTGATIPAGSAVYVSGASGNKTLISLAENDVVGHYPAMGIVTSAINNNSDGVMAFSGQIQPFDTTGYTANQALYVSSTPGQLTGTRPSAENEKVQVIGRVVRAGVSNGIIVVTGAGRVNDIPNLSHNHVFIGNATGYETRQLDTSDILEDATNLFYTDARVQTVIDTNTAGFITDYTVTQADVTQHQAALTITESQISDLDHYTNADFDTQLATKSTSDLTEGSNLYYTDGRVLNWFGTVGLGMLSTDVVPEGSNKYFTDARAITAIESATGLDLNSTVTIEGSVASKSTVIGDSIVGGVYDLHGFTVNAGDTAWSGVNLVEHSGANKPIPNFTNPAFSTTIFGGTVASPAAVETGKRVWSSFALTSPDGNTPSTANFRMLGTTTENQSTSNRGVKFSVETTANGSNSATETLVLQGDTLTVNSGGDGKITTGGNLILDDDVTITGTLNVNGNVTLGDANTDVITATGKLKASNGFKNTVLDTNTANYLANVLGIVEVGDQTYISDGNGGTPCMAFYDGSNWKRMHSPADNISST